MKAADVLAWFDEYLSAFAALGRGELNDPRLLLDYYAVPLVLTTDDAVVALVSDEEVVDAVWRQISVLRDDGYDGSVALTSELSVLNARTALHAAEFSRRRADGSEIGRVAATYLITAGTVAVASQRSSCAPAEAIAATRRLPLPAQLGNCCVGRRGLMRRGN